MGQTGMASNWSFIERRGGVDTLVALLNLLFLTADTCLDFTMLIATDASRHIAMIQAYIALHYADIRTFFLHLWCPTDFTHPHTQSLPPSYTIPHLVPCGISMAGALMLQLRDTMSLSTADLGPVCVASGPMWVKLKHPNRFTHDPLYTSICTGELNAIPKHKCFLCSPFYVKGVSLGHAGRN